MTGTKFRARASECFKVANSTADPEHKLAHLDLAHRWLRLATQLDEMDGDTRGDARPVPLQPPTELSGHTAGSVSGLRR
jgi:hypothetical protein